MDDVLASISKFATKIEGQINEVKQELADIKTRVIHTESQMVTKDYLDKKVIEVEGDLVALTPTS